MQERMVSTEIANETFGRYNGLLAVTQPDNRAHVLQVNSIVDFDPQDPQVYADGVRKILDGLVAHALVRMDIDFTNACNDDCPICFTRVLRELYPDEVPLPVAIRLMGDLKHLGCDCVRMVGGGDPLKHSNFIDLVKYSGLHFKTSIETNGDYLSKPKYTEAIAQYAHRIRVSVDAGDNQTRQLTHRPEDSSYTYDQLIRNISRLRSFSDKSPDRESGLLIGASFVYGPQNYLLIGKFLHDMQDIGVNWVQIKPAFIRSAHQGKPMMDEKVLEQITRAREEKPNGFIMHLLNRVSFAPGQDMTQCWTTQLRAFVLANSLLSICNLVKNLDVPFAKIGALDDSDHPVEHVLFSAEGGKKIQEVQDMSLHGSCTYCIDKVTNITLANMANILTTDRNVVFQRANVLSGDNTIVGQEDRHVINISLNPKDYQVFQKWDTVEF